MKRIRVKDQCIVEQTGETIKVPIMDYRLSSEASELLAYILATVDAPFYLLMSLPELTRAFPHETRTNLENRLMELQQCGYIDVFQNDIELNAYIVNYYKNQESTTTKLAAA
jgi:hypothetical protein